MADWCICVCVYIQYTINIYFPCYISPSLNHIAGSGDNMEPCSCDTFVALPPATVGARIIFGKNSDRPSDEVQEIVYFPGRSYGAGEKLEVTISKIPVLLH